MPQDVLQVVKKKKTGLLLFPLHQIPPPLVVHTSNPVHSRWDHGLLLLCLPATTPTLDKMLDLNGEVMIHQQLQTYHQGPASGVRGRPSHHLMVHCISLGAMSNSNLGEGTTCNNEEACTEAIESMQSLSARLPMSYSTLK